MSGHTVEIPRISWVMWSRRIPDLSPTQKLVLGELARLADWRGETICPVAHLVRTTGRTRRSVHYALSGLVSRGLLDCRRRWHRNGRPATSARRMVALAGVIDAAEIKAVDAAEAEGRETSEAENALVNPKGPKIKVDDNEGLRRAIKQAMAEAWVGPVSETIARSLVAVVAQQFKTAVQRGTDFAFMERNEARWDTSSWAWETLRACAEVIVKAKSPWAMWATATLRATDDRNWLVPEGVRLSELDSSTPIASGAGLRPGDADKVEVVSLDAFETVLGGMVEALIGAGMDEAIAWAGTLRVAELSLKGISRCHQLAADDSRLADLGVSPRCGRAWMTLLVGSRRGAALPVTHLSHEQLAEKASTLVSDYLTDIALAR
ncbi:hypothetical protein [Actinomyces naeslundii]|jgi:hypothetical protein|uniref:hypothetical protein n=1 Tax=Actinomyces naeslundii TaxID=1655 RepID=UPI00096E9748|nr:hypothetical protein [Actinomyces naeslundii]OMG23828.1 hypothetical protein BKH37_02995 [Actinomyces naeslundii]